MKLQKKIILTGLASAGVLLLYAFIFVFSNEDAQQSAVRSERLTKLLVKIFYWLKGSGGTGETAQATASVSVWDGRIRELAHFAEYLGVGFLSYGIVVMWYHPVWRGRLLVVVQLLLSASADEINQRFSPGRSASLDDVLVDMLGGIAGMCLLLICVRLYRRCMHKAISDGKHSSP